MGEIDKFQIWSCSFSTLGNLQECETKLQEKQRGWVYPIILTKYFATTHKIYDNTTIDLSKQNTLLGHPTLNL